MSMRFPMALAIAMMLSASFTTAQNQPARKPDATSELLSKLRRTAEIERVEASLQEFASYVTEKFGVQVLINEAAFKSTDPNANPSTFQLKIPGFKTLSLKSVLSHVLSQIDATFLVYKDRIEIVPIAYAAKETKNVAPSNDEDSPARMAQPLVSMIFKEKPLNEAVAELAEEYDLTVVVLPQSGDARTGFVNARFLNVPADKALEILAIQNDLRVVRKANTFLITTRDHSNDLFNERMERERAKIELEKFRTSPPMPPQPQPPQPQPQPQPVPNPPPKM